MFPLFPGGSAGKACSVGDLSSIPGLGRSPGEGKGYPLRYSGLENSMDCRVLGVAKSRTQQLLSLHCLSFPCKSEGTFHLESLMSPLPLDGGFPGFVPLMASAVHPQVSTRHSPAIWGASLSVRPACESRCYAGISLGLCAEPLRALW